jgi:hypothetical protein
VLQVEVGIVRRFSASVSPLFWKLLRHVRSLLTRDPGRYC